MQHDRQDSGSMPIEVENSIVARRNPIHHESECLLIDCRTAEEYAIAKIEGAVLIPMQEIAERLSELEAWRDKPIVVHCHHGVRSLRVTHFLREKGFSQAQSMKGGIDAWSLEVDPNVPRY